MHRAALLSVVLAACAGDPGTFRPAAGAPEQPAVPTARRVKEVAPECLYLGEVQGEGAYALDNLAITAARHGATSYILQGEDEHAASRTAKVYRCPK